ncbi:MAG TPA: TlyA family RNA methyltransferase [Candidatus Saccharimonadales bacterium]|nr:TlyA family RNA methyltransferase [Candidatus Saccharimonadales bacterium]
MSVSAKVRLDQMLVKMGLVASRSQAESYIKLGRVEVNGRQIIKPGYSVNPDDAIKLSAEEQYVSRAGLKLASIARSLNLDFKDKTVLDIGSSTGGFTDYALRHGACKVIGVDVGTDQLHPSLKRDGRVELHEKTDIRNFEPGQPIDIVLADLSFISLREILPHVASLSSRETQIVAMVKPQFEAGNSQLKHKGVIKNEKMRRDILRDFEKWASERFIVQGKADSQVAGSKGNLERFYLLRKA